VVQEYPEPVGARKSFPALASKIATVKPMASIIRLGNRRPLRNPWARRTFVNEKNGRFRGHKGATGLR
jgi:hypothetical protein